MGPLAVRWRMDYRERPSRPGELTGRAPWTPTGDGGTRDWGCRGELRIRERAGGTHRT